MANLRSQLAEKAKTTAPRINPEIDAKIDKFIGENQGLYDAYMQMDKVVLVRKLMLNRMVKQESVAKRVDSLRQVVDSNPELKARVDAAMAKIAPEKRDRAFRAVAQSAIADQAVQQQRQGARIGV